VEELILGPGNVRLLSRDWIDLQIKNFWDWVLIFLQMLPLTHMPRSSKEVNHSYETCSYNNIHVLKQIPAYLTSSHRNTLVMVGRDGSVVSTIFSFNLEQTSFQIAVLLFAG